MDAHSIIRSMAADADLSMREISRMMGKSPNYIGAMFGQDSTPRADTLAEIAGACGFRVVLTDGAHEYELTPGKPPGGAAVTVEVRKKGGGLVYHRHRVGAPGSD